MHVSFRALDPLDDADIDAMVRWSNDVAIRHLASHFVDAESEARRRTHESVRKSYLEPKHPRQTAMVLVDGVRAGEVNLTIDHASLHRKVPGSAMFGMIIGEASCRSRGVGRMALAHLEDLARASATAGGYGECGVAARATPGPLSWRR